MSVLIKGFKMPISCEFCHLCRWCWDTYAKGLWLEGGIKGRRSWCPLVEVPTPHGRLVDADELEKTAFGRAEKKGNYFNATDFVFTFHDIKTAPTVIEGEA